MMYSFYCYAFVAVNLVSRMTEARWNQVRGSDIPGSDILGKLYTDNHHYQANWMGDLGDHIQLEHINIPGTHDAAAWNYTGPEDQLVNCQDKPLFQQLDSGIRLLDLRFGYSAAKDKLMFYHGPALLSAETTVQDVISGLHQWLKVHPSETLLLSMKVDNGPTDAALQQTMYDLITSEEGKSVWSQLSGELGTLGQVRGKAVLLRRFDWSALANVTDLPGIGLSPSEWVDNDPDFAINYSQNHSALIEDYYEVTDSGGLEGTVKLKINATIAHIGKALHKYNTPNDSGAFWVSFASAGGYNSDGDETITPKTLAVGDGTTAGVNQKLYEWLKELPPKPSTKQRIGAVLLDFYESVDDLVPQILSLNN